MHLSTMFLGSAQTRTLRGSYWIAEQLKSYGFPGLFFLDVYGSDKYGEAHYKELCQRLLSGGHDVQLHTHPHQMYDPKRRNMHQYSLSEQTDIIRDGMTLLKAWTGKSPIGHRAGSYGANEDTLKALEVNGIMLDSSFFHKKRNCQLSFSHPESLRLKAHGLWEIPVTVSIEPIERRGLRFPFWTRHFWNRCIKLDVNTMDSQQLERSITHLNGRIPYIVTFLHSFSFMRHNVPEPD